MMSIQVAFTQNILKNTPLKNTFNMKDVEKAIEGMKEYYKVENGGVSFIQVIDSLPHDASSIHAFSAEYLNETYKITKYKILQENQENKFIIGEGEFNAFEVFAAYPNQYTFTCKPSLRIDAKDGRVRICVSVKNYEQIRTNGNIKEDKSVNLPDISPLNPNNDEHRKMYNKVFLAFAKKAVEVIQDFSDYIHNKQSDNVGDW